MGGRHGADWVRMRSAVMGDAAFWSGVAPRMSASPVVPVEARWVRLIAALACVSKVCIQHIPLLQMLNLNKGRVWTPSESHLDWFYGKTSQPSRSPARLGWNVYHVVMLPWFEERRRIALTVDESRSRLKSWALWGERYNTRRENFGAATGGVFSFFFSFSFFSGPESRWCAEAGAWHRASFSTEMLDSSLFYLAANLTGIKKILVAFQSPGCHQHHPLDCKNRPPDASVDVLI